MNEYGVVTEPRTVYYERLLPGPIERVWAYITESEKRGKWLGTGEMELRVGGRVELKFHHDDLSAKIEPTPERFKQREGMQLVGRVTRCEPPRLLSWIWDVSTGSEVTFELTPRGADVMLALTHRGLRVRNAMLSVGPGWHAHLGVLADNLNGREPGPFWSTFVPLEAEYAKRIPPD